MNEGLRAGKVGSLERNCSGNVVTSMSKMLAYRNSSDRVPVMLLVHPEIKRLLFTYNSQPCHTHSLHQRIFLPMIYGSFAEHYV